MKRVLFAVGAYRAGRWSVRVAGAAVCLVWLAGCTPVRTPTEQHIVDSLNIVTLTTQLDLCRRGK